MIFKLLCKQSWRHPRLQCIKVTLHKDTNTNRRCSDSFTRASVRAPISFAADRCVYLTLNKSTTLTHIAHTHENQHTDLTGDSNLTVSSAHDTKTPIHLLRLYELCSTLPNCRRPTAVGISSLNKHSKTWNYHHCFHHQLWHPAAMTTICFYKHLLYV